MRRQERRRTALTNAARVRPGGRGVTRGLRLPSQVKPSLAPHPFQHDPTRPNSKHPANPPQPQLNIMYHPHQQGQHMGQQPGQPGQQFPQPQQPGAFMGPNMMPVVSGPAAMMQNAGGMPHQSK